MLGISRTSAYEAANRGDIPVLRVGGRWLVPAAKLRGILGLDDDDDGGEGDDE